MKHAGQNRLRGGQGRLVDLETGEGVVTRVPQVAGQYARVIAGHIETIRRGCLACGADHVLLRTDRPVAQGLRDYLAHRSSRI